MDFLLDDEGDLVVTTDIQFTSGIQTIVQGIRVRLETFFGEWFLDESSGLRYFEVIFAQPYNPQVIHEEITRVIVRTPDVDEVAEISSTFSAATRELKVSWRVDTDLGSIDDTLTVEL